MDKDAYTPKETIQMKINFDNKGCNEDISRIKVRFIWEVSSISASGVEFKDKIVMLKRKVDGIKA